MVSLQATLGRCLSGRLTVVGCIAAAGRNCCRDGVCCIPGTGAVPHTRNASISNVNGKVVSTDRDCSKLTTEALLAVQVQQCAVHAWSARG
jgi:hypothetical protein